MDLKLIGGCLSLFGAMILLTILAAQLIRNRYTVLDVLDELGLLREAADVATALMTAQS